MLASELFILPFPTENYTLLRQMNFFTLMPVHPRPLYPPMNYWLVKSEPEEFSWDDHWSKPDRVAGWEGVRNHQAANHLRDMRKGDQAFFYHSGKRREIVGVLEVVRESYPDDTDDTGKGFVMVDFRAIEPLARPVSLKEIKAESKLADMVLVKQPRLSVQPVTAGQWKKVLQMAKQKP